VRRVGFWGAGSEREGDSLASESLPELWQCHMYSPNATHPHRIYFLREIILFSDSRWKIHMPMATHRHTHSSKYLISVITAHWWDYSCSHCDRLYSLQSLQRESYS